MRRRLLAAVGGALGLVATAGCVSLLGDFDVAAGGGSDAGGGVDGSRDGQPPPGDDGGGSDAPGMGDAMPDGGGVADADAGDPHRVVEISAGLGGTVCALTLDGLVYCWGANGAGQVGDGTRTDRTQAVRVQKDSSGAQFANIVEVSAGALHVCARDEYRYYYCWGDDDVGQLGDGRYNTDGGLYDGGLGAVVSLVPQKLSLRGDGPVQIVSGAFHSCVVDDPHLDAGLNLECWGSNTGGELGHDPGTNGDVTASLGNLQMPANPTPLGTTNSARDLSDVWLGMFFGCYLRPDGSVWCWGSNNSQVLGNPSGNDTSTPVEVHGPSNVGYLTNMLEVSARAQLHACARDTTPSGNVWCWGGDDYGEIGMGGSVGTGAASAPVQVQVSNVRQIAIGAYFSCAIIGAQGEVACWGSNSRGQLGHVNLADQTCTGTQTPCDPNPTLVGSMNDGGPRCRASCRSA